MSRPRPPILRAVSIDGRTRRLRANSSVLAVRLVGAVLQVAVIFVVAHTAGADTLGRYVVFGSTVRLVGAALAWGSPMFVLREIVGHDLHGDREASRAEVSDAIRRVGRAGAMVVPVGAALAGWLVGTDRVPVAILVVGVAASISTGLVLVVSSALKARDRQHAAMVLEFAVVPASVVAAAVVVALFREPSFANVASVHAAGVVACACGGRWLWARDDARRRNVGPDAAAGRSRPAGADVDDGRASRTSFGLTTVVNVAAQTAPQLVLPAVMAVADVGRVAAALRVTAAAGIMTTGLASVYAPRFARAWTTGDRRALTHALRETQLWITALYLPFAVAFIVFPEVSAGLLGEELAGVGSALRIMAVAQLVSSACGLAPSALSMGGHERYVLASTASATALGLALTTVGGARWGVSGAAGGYAVVVAARNLLWYGRVRQILNAPGSGSGVSRSR